MYHSSLSRSAARFIISFACVLAGSSATLAQTTAPDPSPAPANDAHAVILDNYVVSATRSPQDPKLTPSSVQVWSATDLAKAQLVDVRTALAQTPGVIVVGTGATGGQTSIYMRGANTDHVLFFVDGVRMNTADAVYTNFLGGTDTLGIDRIEVLRGPQSTLYGSAALGGVIAIETTKGCGPFSGTALASLGSFDSFSSSLSVQGGTAKLGYSASLSTSETDNNRPLNTYRKTSYTTRLEVLATPEFLLGTSLRGQLGNYDEAGPLPLGYSSQGTAEVPNHLLTTYAQWTPAKSLRSRLTAAWHQTEYTWTDKTYGPSSNYYSRNTRQILDWQTTWQVHESAQLVAGANAEWAHYSTTGEPLHDRQRALYANVSLHPLPALTLDLGVRTDDHDLEGRADTWRSGAAYRIDSTGTKLRATYGTGFKAPSMTNRFGAPPWYGPSPTIAPESSTGWDAGIDQEFFSGALTASATYFHNDFDDLIQSIFSNTTYKFVATNAKTARTEGAELTFIAKPTTSLKLRGSYTYLTAFDTSNPTKNIRLAHRPRHTADFDAQWQASPTWLLGSGLRFVSDQIDSASLSSEAALEDYTTVRFYTTYTINADVSIKLRLENALNENYSETPGYQALPRSVTTSIEWKF